MTNPASKITLSLSLLAAVAALAVAGCGGDDDTSSTDTAATGATGAGGTPLSEEEFVSQVSAICADGNDQVAALGPPDTSSVQALGEYAQQVVGVVEPLIQQLEAITAPEDVQSDWDAYLSSLKDNAELDRQLVDAAQAGDTKEVQSIAQQLQANDHDAEAKALGLDECAKDPTPSG